MTDIWGRRLFKAGAVWLVVMGVVHSLSLIRDLAPSNDTERQLVDLMTNYHFNLMGSMRTMGELNRGFSIAFMLAALGFGVLSMTLARERAGLLKRVAVVNLVWLAAMLGTSLRYFFAVPTTFLSVGLLIFLAAWAKLPGEAAS
jgi:hypothetical protein